jgi:RND family efflux transporter MFP subunit
MLSAKTNGVGATEISVLEGERVQKGQLLARFDDRLLRAELAQARANLAFAEADLQQAKTHLKRAETLKQKQTLSEQEFDLIATRASTAQAARDQSAAALTLADIKLSDAVIYAPDDGTILERNLDLGQVPSGGAVLFRLARQHKLEWLAQVDAAQLPKIKTNMTAEINSTSNIGTATKTIAGTVRSVSSQLNKNSRLANVRVLLEGVPELAVNAYVEGKIFIANTAAIVVPANCLVIKDGKTWLFRIKNNTAEQVLVSLGRRHEDKIEIINNISIGDVLAQEGAGFLNDGDKVTILTAPLKSAGAN